MKILFYARAFVPCYVNSLDAYVPELWAQESLQVLEENMVSSRLVHRDFEPLVAEFGDQVNTRKPANFSSLPKGDDDDVTDQDATATNVAVVLNRQLHVTFVIKDGQASRSFKNLVAEFLRPAMIAHATTIDRIVLGQYPQFLPNLVGKLGTAVTRDTIVDTHSKMNVNLAPMMGRNLVLGSVSEGDALKIDLFTQAQQVGDSGEALREASLGRKFGFNTFMDQNMASVATGNTVVTGAVNNGAGYAAGAVTATVDGLSAAISVGTWFTIAGDMTPLRVVSTVGAGTPTSITFTPALKSAVVDDAVITLYTPGQINLAAGYAAGWSKAMVIDTFTVAPKVGQIVSFGVSSTSATYTVVAATTTSLTLDRALEVALADDDKVNIGPKGNYNLAFNRSAIALVTRPLALPMAGTGARAANLSYNNLSIRVVMTYDGKAQGTRVTLDLLCGVKTLDTALGAVLLG